MCAAKAGNVDIKNYNPIPLKVPPTSTPLLHNLPLPHPPFAQPVFSWPQIPLNKKKYDR
jgi:hypothetical protein